MLRVHVQIQILPHGRDLPLPDWQTAGAAGADLHAAIEAPVVLSPGERRVVPTGVAIALPGGLEAQVRPRSGLAVRHGVTVLNAPGTIDADYRGEILVPLIHHGDSPLTLSRGDRIAQLVIAPVVRADWVPVEVLPQDTARGEGRFGSTGVSRPG